MASKMHPADRRELAIAKAAYARAEREWLAHGSDRNIAELERADRRLDAVERSIRGNTRKVA